VEKKQQKPGDIPACYHRPFDLVYWLVCPVWSKEKVEHQLPEINRTVELIKADLASGTVLEYK